jgi:hypothetical protein
MSAIYGSYAGIRMWWGLVILQSRMYLCELCILRFDDMLTKLKNTLQHFFKISSNSLCRLLKLVLNLANRLLTTKHPKKHPQSFNRSHNNNWIYYNYINKIN